jgi:hypothetical protein
MTKTRPGRNPGGVARPGRAFRPDASPPLQVWSDADTRGGATWRELIPPGPDRERAIADIRDHFDSLTGALGPAVEELRAIMAAHEPVELISSIVIPASMRFAGLHDAFSDATDTVTWAAKIEYLVGVALSVPPGAGSTPLAVSQRAMNLVSDVFDAVHAQQMLDSFDRPRGSNAAFDAALFLLRMEHLFDRMPGYAVHLERIDAEIFDRHGDFYIDTIGFNPADVIRVVRRHSAAIQARGNLAMKDAQRLRNRDPDGSALAVAGLLEALTDSRTWNPDEVARDTQIDAGQISLMLAFFSTTFGAQPEFRLPTDRNLARTNPAIALGSRTYFVPDPWTLAAAVHDRLAQLASTGAQLQRYRRHREQGHQRLVANAFRAVFPDAIVTEGQHYVSDSDGAGEIDVLVALEWPLIIEAKAHGLTPSGRRGAPGRVERVVSEVIEKALQQTRRAVTYVVEEGQRAFAVKQGAATIGLLPDRIVGATEIIVTFERIDPLAMQGPATVGQAARSVWVVSIADLLMVADILNVPSELHHYARTRATNAVGAQSFTWSPMGSGRT